MSDIVLNNLQADLVNTTELHAGNALFTGSARFAQPIYTNGIQNSENINQVTTSTTVPDSYFVLLSDGTSLKRITFANLCAAIATKLGIDPAKDYLYD